ncbi:MAG TPA: hypothetical protein VE262_00840 [Blastocatellia bacterium]|nr:hypothetical protein [Blastocatellia bacterium]
MSEDHIQHRMDFIVEQQAKFSVDIELLREAIGELREGQKSLTRDVRGLTQVVNILQSEMREGFNETREAINNLIEANEVTRKLTEDVAHLAINTSRRVDVLEGRS